ncbi:MAG: hypothetical protein H6702_21700 [Myxococcales bacterium]|nr:hypothetical protein [Myxococcales bacterium]
MTPADLPAARARSDVYEDLVGELVRYIDDKGRGKSLLLGGPRGAGKTTAVQDAARRANRECRAAELLLVELPAPLLNGALDPGAADAPDAGSLLKGLAVGLFDALHLRTVDRFIERLGQGRPVGDDEAELIAQLSVELGRAPSLGRLRSLWEAAGVLRSGVFPDDPRFEGQGAMEVAALWSTTQVHLMATGKLEQTLADQASADRQVDARLDSKVSGSQILNPLLGTLAAAFAGYEVAHGGRGVLAALVAVLTGVATTTALNLTVVRTLKQREERTVKFTPDTGTPALARHLPQVIKRLNEAGLRPVFLIDEIDKLDDPVGWLDALGDSIKSLLTHSAFFVFLVDQRAYEALEARAVAEPFGKLHSRFTKRAFLTYAPAEFRRALLCREHAHPPESVTASLAAHAAVLRAKGNPLDANRIYDRLVAAGPAQGHRRALLRTEWWLEHLVEWQLGAAPLADWCARDSWHWQAAFDALYAIRGAWEADAPPPADDAALVAALEAAPGSPRGALLVPQARSVLLQALAAVVAALANPAAGPAATSPDGVPAALLPPLWHEGRWALDIHGLSRAV